MDQSQRVNTKPVLGFGGFPSLSPVTTLDSFSVNLPAGAETLSDADSNHLFDSSTKLSDSLVRSFNP